MNKKFDAEFAKVAGLRWIPWVGDNYENASCKVLVVGESVYATNDNEDLDEHYEIVNSNPDYVRDRNVKWWSTCPIEKLKKFPKNTCEILTMSNTNMTKDKFWNGIAFTELVQEAMINSQKRPNSLQRANGLIALYKVIEILNPDYVLFLGNEGLKDQFVKKAAKMLNIDFVECEWKESENVKNHLRVSFYKQCPLIGIPHPSTRTMCSAKNRIVWNNEIKRHYPDMINYFNSL